MSNNVELTYRREGEKYIGTITYRALLIECKKGWTFDAMMMRVHQVLVTAPAETGVLIRRTDRAGLLPAQLEPRLLELLRTDPVGYIRANTIAPRTIDLRSEKKSALASGEKYDMPKTAGLRHGLDTLAAAFGEELYTKAKGQGRRWVFEHPGTGRWTDLNTLEHWLGTSKVGPVLQVNPETSSLTQRGYLAIAVELLLNTKAERFYYPREWNEFGSWITKEQLRAKLDQYKKEKQNVPR